MSFLINKPAEIRAPETIVLPDNRKRLTRFFAIAHVGVIPPQLDYAWGTLDPITAPTGWDDLRLVGRRLDDEVARPGQDTRPICSLIYEQIDASAETRVGSDIISKDDDGSTEVVQEWVQFSTGTYTPGTVNSTTAVGFGTAYLEKEESTDDGTVRRIKRQFTTAGIIATDDQSKNGGALLLKSITSVRTVPSTPSGFTPVGTPVQKPGGMPIYTYTFAKGNGQYEDRDEARADGSFVYYRTTFSAAAATPSTPSGSTLVELTHKAEDGFFVNNATFIKQPATVAYRQTIKVPVPGLAYFIGTDLILQPPTVRTLLATITVSFSTSQDTATPFSVTTYGSFTETYIPTASGQPINKQYGLNGYLCTGTTISGSGTYKGVAVDSYSATRTASNPTSLPTGTTTLSVDNEPYFTSLAGVMMFKITVTTASL